MMTRDELLSALLAKTSDETLKEIYQEAGGGTDAKAAEAPKKRGRPPGAKNKPKVRDDGLVQPTLPLSDLGEAMGMPPLPRREMTQEELLEYSRQHPPAQEWFDEDMTGLTESTKEAEPQKPRRGRPPGSKNKPKLQLFGPSDVPPAPAPRMVTSPVLGESGAKRENSSLLTPAAGEDIVPIKGKSSIDGGREAKAVDVPIERRPNEFLASSIASMNKNLVAEDRFHTEGVQRAERRPPSRGVDVTCSRCHKLFNVSPILLGSGRDRWKCNSCQTGGRR